MMEQFESDSKWFSTKQAEHRAKKPAMWEYGDEILLRIDGRNLTVHNGAELLAVWENNDAKY